MTIQPQNETAEQLSLELWSCDAGQIRVSSSGQPSVFDMIKVLGGQKNPHDTWARLTESHSEVSSWVCMHKFPGRGQRDTPVLSDPSYIDGLTKFIHDHQCKQGLRKYAHAETLRITERSIQSALVRYLRECNEHPREFVPCASGVADIVTEATVIEVKNVANWKAAIGQVMAYSRDLRLYPELALFGRANFALILERCTDLGIACSCYPSDNPATLAFLEDKGAHTFDNLKDVRHMIKVAVAARYN